jgi:hypothetical protein
VFESHRAHPAHFDIVFLSQFCHLREFISTFKATELLPIRYGFIWIVILVLEGRISLLLSH